MIDWIEVGDKITLCTGGVTSTHYYMCVQSIQFDQNGWYVLDSEEPIGSIHVSSMVPGEIQIPCLKIEHNNEIFVFDGPMRYQTDIPVILSNNILLQGLHGGSIRILDMSSDGRLNRKLRKQNNERIQHPQIASQQDLVRSRQPLQSRKNFEILQ